jgi:predicted phosphodiesterase
MLERVGVLGDVHAEDRRLAAALACFAKRGVDAVLAVGDLVDGSGDVEATLALLDDAGVIGVRGNHDRWLLDDHARSLPGAHRRDALSRAALAYLQALPTTRVLETTGGSALLCHGVGNDDLCSLLPEDDAASIAASPPMRALLDLDRHAWMIGGHTHRPMARMVGGLAIVNAGTLLDGPGRTLCEIDFALRAVQWFAFEDETPVPTRRDVLDDDDAWWAY